MFKKRLAGREAQHAHHEPDGAGHAYAVGERHRVIGEHRVDALVHGLVDVGVVRLRDHLLGQGPHRVLVGLEELEQAALGKHPVHQVGQADAPLLEGRVFLEKGHRLPLDLDQRLHERAKDHVLAREVVVEGGFGHTDALGDLAQRRLVESLLDEEIEGGVEDVLSGVFHLVTSLRRGRGVTLS